MDRITPNTTPIVTPSPTPVVDETVLKRQYLLQQNPFLIQEDLSSMDIATMDDFFVQYRKDRIPLGTLMSSNDFKKGKKQSIIKSNFKRWKNEYKAKLKQFRTELEQQKTMAKNLAYNPFPFYIQLIYLFVFLVGIMFFYNFQIFSQTPGFYNWLLKIHHLIYGDKLLEFLTLALLGYLFFIILFGTYQNFVLKKFRKRHLASQRTMKGKERRVKSHFRSCFKKAYKHYLDLATNNYYKPYSSKNLIEERYRFNTITVEKDIAIANASNFKKNNFRFKVKKFLANAMAILLGGALIVLIILRLI